CWEIVLPCGETRELQQRTGARLTETLGGLPMRASLIPLTRPGERKAEIVTRLRIGRVARESPGQPAHRPGWLVRCDAGCLSPVQSGRETPSRFIDLNAI